VLRQVRARWPKLRVIVLTMHAEEQFAVRVMRMGAAGYVTKDSAGEELVQAIRAAHAGRATLSAGAAQALVDTTQQPPAPELKLSEREMEVLRLMVEGLNNTQIAAKLTVSPSTIKSHVSNILSKLGVASRTEAVTLALRTHIVS
jgi:NarL family two-component system response regulator LiaR